MVIEPMKNKSKKIQKALMLSCLIEKYYDTDVVGGSLHIVLDDGNYNTSSVEFCLNYSIEKNDYWGELIANLLLEFTEDERNIIIEEFWNIEDKIR